MVRAAGVQHELVRSGPCCPVSLVESGRGVSDRSTKNLRTACATTTAGGRQGDVSVPATTGPFGYEHSPHLPGILSDLGVCLIVSTYQAGKLAVFRSRDDQLSLLLRNFEHAMGVVPHRDRIAVGTRYHVWFLENDVATGHSSESAQILRCLFLSATSTCDGEHPHS